MNLRLGGDRGQNGVMMLLALCFLTVFSGARYHPKVLSPVETVIGFESRRLDDPGLKRFIEFNRGHSLETWPPKHWDLSLLTFVSFYFHPDFQVSRAQWELSKAGIQTAAMRPNPYFSGVGTYIQNFPSNLPPWIFQNAIFFTFETAHKRKYRTEQAQNLAEANRWKLANAAWLVRSRVRAQYIALLQSKQKLDILHQQELAQLEVVKGLEKRLALGEGAEPDVIQSQSNLAQICFQRAEIEKLHQDYKVQLASALGVPDIALAEIKFQENLDVLPDSTEENPLLPSLRESALINRPDLRSLFSEYQASQSALQLEISKQYPNLILGPGYTYESRQNRFQLPVSNLTLPIFNQNQGPIAEAEARRTEVASRFLALQNKVFGDIERGVSLFQTSLKSFNAANAFLLSQQRKLDQIHAQFDSGEVDRLAFRTAEIELNSAKLLKMDALLSLHQAIGLLEDSIQHPLPSEKGSGWGEPLPKIPEESPQTPVYYQSGSSSSSAQGNKP